mmetsp:Transcript_2118/g.3387  ORF Transcript_2118/g.3387 Transcript_2118/m.3387 type:complete len:605 (-) Transcript_2118:1357-3171(-)
MSEDYHLLKSLETGDFSQVFDQKAATLKNPIRGWNALHYACQFRNLSAMLGILKKAPYPTDMLAAQDNSGQRPCDLLPLSEGNFGSLFSWGVGPDFQLGYSKEKQNLPRKVEFTSLYEPEENISELATNKYHTLCVTDQGKVYGFGSGIKGVLGREGVTITPFPVELPRVTSVAAGELHSLCLTEAGDVFAWGDNSHGQLGLEGIKYSAKPLQVSYLKKVLITKVAAGKNHSGSLSNYGRLYIWGDTFSSQCYKGLFKSNIKDFTLFDITGISSDDYITHLAMGEDTTCIGTNNSLLVTPGTKNHIQLHIPARIKDLSCLSASSTGIYAVTAAGQLFFAPSKIKFTLRSHYKMQHLMERVCYASSGEKSCAVTERGDLYFLEEEGPKLCPLIAGVKKASVYHHHSMAIVSTSKPNLQLPTRIPSLLEISEYTLSQLINIHSAPDLLNAADMLNCQVLKQACEEFISKNLKIFLTPQNIDHFLAINSELLDPIQNLIGKGQLDPIEIPLPKTETSAKPKKKKKKKKTRALSNLEETPKLQSHFPKHEPARERANTDADPYPLQNYIPPPASKAKPWGDVLPATVSFETQQKKRKVQPCQSQCLGF